MSLRSKIFEANKKGLFAVATGEGNISASFALVYNNARSSINAEVAKRRGQTRLNTVQWPSALKIKSLALYEGDFVANYEVLAYAGTELRRLTPATGAFDVVIKSGLANDTKLFHSAFNGKLVFANGVNNMFKYGYLPRPVAPTTSTISSGSLAGRTYYVKLTYLSANGETIASLPTTQVIAVNNVLLIDEPVLISGATQYRVYVGTVAGQETLQATVNFTTPGVAPTLGQTASGTLAAQTYYVKTTYLTPGIGGGETLASLESSINVALNNVLTVTSPGAYSGATQYNVYASTIKGEETLQATVNIGTGWQEPNSGLITGVFPPPTRWREPDTGLVAGVAYPTTNTAWYCVDLGGQAPVGKFIYAVNHRLWVAGMLDEDTRVIGCAPDNEDDWFTTNAYFQMDMTGVIAKGDKIQGLARIGQTNELIIGLKSHLVIYAVPVTVTDIALQQVLYNVGIMSHQAITEIGNDTYIIGIDGANSLRRQLLLQSLDMQTVSRNVKDGLIQALLNVPDPQAINSIYYPRENEYRVSIPSLSQVWQLNYRLQSWNVDTKANNDQTWEQVVTPDGYILSANNNGWVHREYKDASGNDVYGDDDNSVDVPFQWDTPWLWLDDVAHKKIFKYFSFKGTGEGQFTMDVYIDFATVPYKTHYLQSFPSQFDNVSFDQAYFDFPDVNKVLIPLLGRGKAVKFSFKATHQKLLTISFYGLQYTLSGLRGNE